MNAPMQDHTFSRIYGSPESNSFGTKIVVIKWAALVSPFFNVYRHDEAGLPSEIETVEIISLGLEDHGLRSHAALPRSGY